MLTARFGGGLLIGQTFAADLVYERQLWFGTLRSSGPSLQQGVNEFGVDVHIATT